MKNVIFGLYHSKLVTQVVRLGKSGLALFRKKYGQKIHYKN